MKYDLLIKNGTVIFPEKRTEEKVNIAVKDGKVAWIGEKNPDAKSVINCSKMMVSPGFIDSHAHDEEIADGKCVQQALLRQGVTTMIAGNCGSGLLKKNIEPFRQKPWLNLGFLTGHKVLREAAGCNDIYAAATKKQTEEMKRLLKEELSAGSFGLSFGLEYLPNTSAEEIEALLETAKEYKNIWIPVHLRTDGPECVEALREVIDLSKKWQMRFQISHTGSMTAFGEMDKILKMIDRAVACGTDITFDCYPYAAFCTRLGSAVFDEGFERRWGKGTKFLEVGTGKQRGRRLDEIEDGQDLYTKLRREEPEALVIAHVIRGDEVERCLCHPRCAIASDALLKEGHGHPRAAGTFPRTINILRKNDFSWAEAIRKCTTLPADMTWLEKGRIAVGCDADIVIFDPEKFTDRATFENELLPPDGVKYVIIGGRIAVKDSCVTEMPLGSLMQRRV